MSKLRTIHRCTECGGASPQWVGRCPTCGEWNTLVEEVDEPVPSGAARAGLSLGMADRPVPIADVRSSGWSVRPTGIGELDRVLGGGLVPGSVTLLGGEPGIGKSTLLLQALASTAATGAKVLLVSAEESKEQVRLRAERLGTLAPTLWLLSETNLAGIQLAVAEVEPELLVVDSIQTVFDPELGSTPGSVTQVRGCAQQLVTVAKERGMATVLVGHVTKEGALAGPRLLEHLVDTVLSFEGERHHALRLLRASKHRFGATGELGLFEMSEEGMVGVPDPSGLFLGDRRTGAAGSVVVPAMEGKRPLLVELQALVTSSQLTMPRRSAQGVDGGRLSLLTAVLDKRAGVGFGTDDVWASAVGGVRIGEPAADLGLALALVSSKFERTVAPDVVACGEVGLAGEIRQVSHTVRRLAEAARLGFTVAVVPPSAPEPPRGMRAIRVPTIGAALHEMGLVG